MKALMITTAIASSIIACTLEPGTLRGVLIGQAFVLFYIPIVLTACSRFFSVGAGDEKKDMF